MGINSATTRCAMCAEGKNATVESSGVSGSNTIVVASVVGLAAGQAIGIARYNYTSPSDLTATIDLATYDHASTPNLLDHEMTKAVATADLASNGSTVSPVMPQSR